jgi:phosphate acyltransferase
VLAIDLMGGDLSPEERVAAVADFLLVNIDVHVFLIGDKDLLILTKQLIPQVTHKQIQWLEATQYVEMDESPLHALRHKKDSSMRMALDLVKSGEAKACLSAGNTGALMLMSHHVLRTIEGIDRPALLSKMPTLDPDHQLLMLDLGANPNATAEHLYQYAQLGSMMVMKDEVKIALLNIGHERIKGNALVQKADKLLSNLKGYKGFIEPDQLLFSKMDVIVCDGFTGNIVLKSMEGVARAFYSEIHNICTTSFLYRVIGILLKPILRSTKSKFDPKRHNGALLLGLNGLVIKSHGAADQQAFYQAIEFAVKAQSRLSESMFSRASSIPELDTI